MGPFKAGDISGHGKTQQLELRQPPPSLNNIPVREGLAPGSKGKAGGWLGREMRPKNPWLCCVIPVG